MLQISFVSLSINGEASCLFTMYLALQEQLTEKTGHHYAEFFEQKHAVLSNSEDQYMKFLVTDYELDRDFRLSWDKWRK